MASRPVCCLLTRGGAPTARVTSLPDFSAVRVPQTESKDLMVATSSLVTSCLGCLKGAPKSLQTIPKSANNNTKT